MEVCIPTAESAGLDASISAHFGQAPYYTIVTTSDGSVEVVENTSDHYGGSKRPPVFVADLGVDAVVVETVGKRSMETFAERGIDVYEAPADTVDAVLTALDRQELERLEPADAHPSGHHRRG